MGGAGRFWFAEHNDERVQRGQPALAFGAYLRSAHFLEATAENWESEFLQMGAYVALTAYLFQRGSAESKDPDEAAPQDGDSRSSQGRADAPSPVRRGGWIARLYEHSLALAFLLLFLASAAVHAAAGARSYSEEQVARGRSPVSGWEYLGTSRFWFESLQNWQSEFLAMASMVGLSIFLRQRGSPQSKPVAAPHRETGA